MAYYDGHFDLKIIKDSLSDSDRSEFEQFLRDWENTRTLDCDWMEGFNYDTYSAVIYDTSREVPGLINILSGMYDMIIVQLKMPGWMVCKAIDGATGNQNATELYIGTMELVMQLFAAIDGNTDAKEEKFINDFISRMKRDR